MVTLSLRGGRALILLLLMAICVMLDVDAAHAQAAQCVQLQNMLVQVERQYQGAGGADQAARQLQREVQAMESRYIREGCNDAAKAGIPLTPQCRQIGRDVLSLREQAAAAAQQAEAVNAVGGQREAILQEMARFGCGQGSSANFSVERQGLFDRIFGTTSEGDFTNGQMIDGGDYWGYQGYQTIRTVCVRISDGYFWPISYSTLPDYLGNDAQACQASCPTTPVDLYYYDNPGQEPEQMRNLMGEPYTALPTAFKYREAFDETVSCKVAPQSDGTVRTTATADGTLRSEIEVNGVIIPMPRRDPRGVAPVQAPIEAPLEVANLVDVPLPRPRPAGPGETAISRPVAQTQQEEDLRLVQFGDKVVRVVGPDTPYAQPAGAGT